MYSAFLQEHLGCIPFVSGEARESSSMSQPLPEWPSEVQPYLIEGAALNHHHRPEEALALF